MDIFSARRELAMTRHENLMGIRNGIGVEPNNKSVLDCGLMPGVMNLAGHGSQDRRSALSQQAKVFQGSFTQAVPQALRLTLSIG